MVISNVIVLVSNQVLGDHSLMTSAFFIQFTPSTPLSAYHLLLTITFTLTHSAFTMATICRLSETNPHMDILKLDSGVVFASVRKNCPLQFCYSFGIRLVQGGAMPNFNQDVAKLRLNKIFTSKNGQSIMFFKADISTPLTPFPPPPFWS